MYKLKKVCHENNSPLQNIRSEPEPFECNTSVPVSHRLTVNITGVHKVIRKTVDLPQWFGIFTMVTESTNAWSFGAHLLPNAL